MEGEGPWDGEEMRKQYSLTYEACLYN